MLLGYACTSQTSSFCTYGNIGTLIALVKWELQKKINTQTNNLMTKWIPSILHHLKEMFHCKPVS
jgi:hypothetical protein